MKNVFIEGFEIVKVYIIFINGELFSFVVGSNIVGFVKVVRVMYEQGDWF